MVPSGLNIMKEKPVFDWIKTAIVTRLLCFLTFSLNYLITGGIAIGKDFLS